MRDDLPPEELESSYPLSPMQQGMLFHSLYSWNSGVDVEQMVCTLEEPLDPPLLRLAWERLVARHPILRTSFRWERLEEPLQDVHLSANLPWREEDWRKSPPEEMQQRLQCYLDQDRQKGFDLRRAPLMRIALFRRVDTAESEEIARILDELESLPKKETDRLEIGNEPPIRA